MCLALELRAAFRSARLFSLKWLLKTTQFSTFLQYGVLFLPVSYTTCCVPGGNGTSVRFIPLRCLAALHWRNLCHDLIVGKYGEPAALESPRSTRYLALFISYQAVPAVTNMTCCAAFSCPVALVGCKVYNPTLSTLS